MQGESSDQNPAPPSRTGFFQLLKTAAAAAIGVQSNKNREADFAEKSVLPFILIGVFFTAVFILTLVGIVSLVI